MTSNVGSQMIFDAGEQPPADLSEKLMGILQKYFKPEFLNRLDDIIIFHRLSKEQIKQIVNIQLKDLQERLQEKRISLKVTDEALEAIAGEGYDPQFGARPLKRVIQKEIENNLAMQMLGGNITEDAAVTVDFQNKDFIFKKD